MRRLTLAMLLATLASLVTMLPIPIARADDAVPVLGADGAGITVTSDGRSGTSEAGGSGPRCVWHRVPIFGGWDNPIDPTQWGDPPWDPSIRIITAPTMDPDGSYYYWSCDSGSRAVQWVNPGTPAVDPAMLAQIAFRYVRLPAPTVRTDPPRNANQVVHVPTWLWIDRAGWTTRSATASVVNESATVTATPLRVVWNMGDGSVFQCRQGTPYNPGTDPAKPSPTCGHTYRRSSAGQTGERFHVTATTVWRVTWTATGAVNVGQTLLGTRSLSGSADLRVVEVQTIN